MALKHIGFALAATIMASNAAVAVAQDAEVPVTTTDDDDDEGKIGLLGLLGLAGLLGLKRRDRHDHTTTTNRH